MTTRETVWLCEHARALEKFSGQYVKFSVDEGLVCAGETLTQVLSHKAGKKSHAKPFVFHVPSKDELSHPLQIVK
jgi:Family of unknown function (DUF5678)